MVLRLRLLLALILFLITILIGIIVLNHFSRRGLLYSTAFLYQTNFSLFTTQLPSIAPFSILPTLIAVGVGLWWGAIDSTFRRLQPHLSMAESPKQLSQGVGLSYESSYWIHAAVKAAFNKHWLLSLITFGTFLCSICKFPFHASINTTTGLPEFQSQFPCQRCFNARREPYMNF